MRTRLLSTIASAILVVGLTAGCQASAPDLGAEQAKTFQARVLAVSSSVADGGYAAALEELTALETELDAAAADGTVSFSRHQRIDAALAVVKADLQAAIDAQAPVVPTETVAPVAPTDEADTPPDEETEAEKKAREATEKAAEEAKKKAEEAAKKLAEEQKKAEEKAEKDAEDDGEDGEE